MARRPFDPKQARGGDPASGGQFDLFGGGPDSPPEATSPAEAPPPVDDGPPRRDREPPPISVSQLGELIGSALSALPARLRVIGEVGRVSVNRHLYFNLKDESAEIACVMWASSLRGQSPPREGDQVELRGQVVHFAGRGRTQLQVYSINPIGLGALEARLRAMKEKLRGLGYFEESRKRPLPAHPKAIAIVTGRGSAALADCLRTARDRMPSVEIVVVPVKVQGEGAAEEVARAITALDAAGERLGLDAICVTRGGGSLEDLWAFNEQIVADAVFHCRTPVVAAIGHEIDTLVVELVADLRASTPTQAMMRLLPDRETLRGAVAKDARRLQITLKSRLSEERSRLKAIARHPFLRRPGERIAETRERLSILLRDLKRSLLVRLERDRGDFGHRRQRIERAIRSRLPDREDHRAMATRLARGVRGRLEVARVSLAGSGGRLRSIGPAAVLARGYAILRDGSGRIVRAIADAEAGDEVSIAVRDGTIAARVESRRGGDPLEPPRA